MKANSTSRLVRRFLLPAALSAGLLAGGCATHTTANGRETTLLGGAVTITTNSFQPPTPTAAVDVDTSKLVGKGNPSGRKISLLWGLINLHDY